MANQASIKTSTYVEFYCAGSFFVEQSVREVEHRNPAAIEVPDNAFAFRFFDRTSAVIGDEPLEGRAKNYSGTFYVGGTVYDAEDIPDTPDLAILRSNAVSNDMRRVIRCRFGNWQPFKDGDVLLNKDNLE